MIHIIPKNKLESLEKQFNRVIKKGANISFKVLNEREYPINVTTNEGSFDTFQDCVEIDVDGEYQVNGWKFVATLEHLNKSNVIRQYDYNVPTIPDKYKHCDAYCEHCNTLRDRKDTYLVYNSENDEWKQVGKSCLKDLTNGLDADICASQVEYMSSIVMFEDTLNSPWTNVRNIDCKFGVSSIKKYLVHIVDTTGYIKADWGKSPTVEKFENLLFSTECSKITKDYSSKISLIDEFASNHYEDDGYMGNASRLWLEDYCSQRDFPLLCSFVNTYNKFVAKEDLRQKEISSKKQSSYVGNIGDRVEISVSTFRFLYTKEYMGHESFVYEIIGNDGNVYIWSSSNGIDVDMYSRYKATSIKATIKGHKEYNGVKQTLITRGKVEYTQEKN